MKLRYHSDSSRFYDKDMNLYPEPKESLEELEVKLKEVCEKLKSLPNPKPASEYLDDANEDLFFDIRIARFNLCSFIENLEWKIDLKLFMQKLPFGLNFWCGFVIYTQVAKGNELLELFVKFDALNH